MDKSEIRKWHDVFIGGDGLFEIRILGRFQYSGYFKSVDSLLDAIQPFIELDDEQCYFIFAIESMPQVAQVISNIVPTKWFISASRKIMVEGVSIQYVATEIRALVIEGLIFMLLAWRFFKTRLA